MLANSKNFRSLSMNDNFISPIAASVRPIVILLALQFAAGEGTVSTTRELLENRANNTPGFFR